MHSAPVEMGHWSAESRFTTNIPSPSGPVRHLHRGRGGEMKMHVSDFVMHYLISKLILKKKVYAFKTCNR